MTGNAEGFGEAVELDETVLPARIGEQPMWGAVAVGEEVAIGLVNDQPDAACAADLENRLQHGLGIDGAGRVVGRHQHDSARALSDRGGDGIRRWHETIRGVRVDGSDSDAQHVERHLVVEIERAHQDHLVARRRQRQHRREEGLVAARRDLDFACRDRRPVESRRHARHRLRAAPPRLRCRHIRYRRRWPTLRPARQAGRRAADSRGPPAKNRAAARAVRHRRAPNPELPGLAGPRGDGRRD